MRYLINYEWAIEMDEIASLSRKEGGSGNSQYPVCPRIFLRGEHQSLENIWYLTEGEYANLLLVFLTGQLPPPEWGTKEQGPTQEVKAVIQDERGILWSDGNNHWIADNGGWHCVPPTCKTPEEALEWIGSKNV